MRHTLELDGIRGWACGSVLIAHCLTGIAGTGPNSWFATFNTYTLWLLLSGVDLFFVLSGFLIGGILLDSRDDPNYFRNFWIRRIARIFPVAYLVLICYALTLLIVTRFGIGRFDNWLLAEYRPPLWSFATFTQSIPIALHGYGGPRFMAMTWSLAIEEQFYLFFPFAVYLLPRRWLIGVVVGGIVVAPVLRDVFTRVLVDWYSGYVLMPSRMDSLMFGVVVALIVRNGYALQLAYRFRFLLDLVGLACLYAIITNYAFDFWPSLGMAPLKQSAFALMWAIVILRIFTYKRSMFNKIWRWPLLAKIGLISYALYMYHQAVNGLVHGVLFNQEPQISTPVQLIAALAVIAISVGFATLSYRYFEMPIRRYCVALADRLNKKDRSLDLSRVHDGSNDAPPKLIGELSAAPYADAGRVLSSSTR
jgi:peptidoglycan/LPS O-acetylase OafA/YrhL